MDEVQKDIGPTGSREHRPVRTRSLENLPTAASIGNRIVNLVDENIRCNKCRKWGHRKSTCPQRRGNDSRRRRSTKLKLLSDNDINIKHRTKDESDREKNNDDDSDSPRRWIKIQVIDEREIDHDKEILRRDQIADYDHSNAGNEIR